MQEVIEALRDFSKRLKKDFEKDFVSLLLFGSYARGEGKEASDVDIFLVFRDLPKERLKRNILLSPYIDVLESALSQKMGRYIFVSPLIKTVEEAKYHSPIYLDFTEDAIIIHDEGDFIRCVLDQVREELKKYGAKREYVGRMWYWDLKPDYKFGDLIQI
jgi:hypothetical protein